MSAERIEYNELLPLGIRMETFDDTECIADTDYKKKKDEQYQEFIDELKRQTVPYEV